MWFRSLPGCQTTAPCGEGTHAIRWEAGELRLPEHADIEAELVLAALGADRHGCLDVAQAWSRRAADLSVLAVGPRDAADAVTVSWARVAAVRDGPRARWAPGPGRPRSMPMRLGRPEPSLRLRQETDLLTLLALGPRFQLRLAGHVAAAHADRLADADRPAIAAALHARLVPAVTAWAGLGPSEFDVTVHDGSGWGTVTRGAGRLSIALPTGWLAEVWACGLALVAGHLVVAVPRPGWPDAQVLAQPAPGAEPVLLSVHGAVGRDDTPHWDT
jgi:hypothetical protein